MLLQCISVCFSSKTQHQSARLHGSKRLASHQTESLLQVQFKNKQKDIKKVWALPIKWIDLGVWNLKSMFIVWRIPTVAVLFNGYNHPTVKLVDTGIKYHVFIK